MKRTIEIYVCESCGLVYRVIERKSPEVNPVKTISVMVNGVKLYIVVRVGLCDQCYEEVINRD